MPRGARLDGRAFCETGVLVRPRLVFVVSGAALWANPKARASSCTAPLQLLDRDHLGTRACELR